MTSYAQNQEGDKVIYKIRVNQRCRLYIDDEELQILEPSKLVKVLLDKGEYLRKVVSLENESLYDEKNICLLGNSVLDDIKLEGGNQEQHEDSTPKQPVQEVITVNGISFTMVQIEAGTFMFAAAATKGDVTVKNVIPKHLEATSAKLVEAGCTIEEFDDAVRVISEGKLQHTQVTTLPYPGFPTDMQPQMAVALALADGTSTVTENLFENRFKYTQELIRMGAKISIEGRTAVIKGVRKLYGTTVKATDLRGGASLVLAGIAAKGTSTSFAKTVIKTSFAQFEYSLLT